MGLWYLQIISVKKYLNFLCAEHSVIVNNLKIKIILNQIRVKCSEIILSPFSGVDFSHNWYNSNNLILGIMDMPSLYKCEISINWTHWLN